MFTSTRSSWFLEIIEATKFPAIVQAPAELRVVPMPLVFIYITYVRQCVRQEYHAIESEALSRRFKPCKGTLDDRQSLWNMGL